MFLIDANVLITAKNRHYGMDFVPGFRRWLADEHDELGLRSIDAVRHELFAQDDELAAWTKELPSSFWLEETEKDVAALRAVAQWTMSEERAYRSSAQAEFLDNADYRLVAMAHAGAHVIVTHEVPAPDSKSKIKIPDAAAAFGVVCREPFGVLRESGLLLGHRVG